MRRFRIALLGGSLAWACFVLLSGAGVSRADDKEEALRAEIDRQKKELEELKQRLDALTSRSAGEAAPAEQGQGTLDQSAVRGIVADYLKEQDKKKKDDEAKAKQKADEEGYKVGTLLGMSARWDTSSATWKLETPNKDFVFHAGYRFQLDNVYFDQNPEITQRANQVGDLQDGIFFRRSRPSFDGVLWQVVEFNCELALEQVQASVPNFDEVWVGLRDIPLIGSVRIGHNKVPQGFEGDMVSSSKAMTFLERSAYTDAFYENFATGIWVGNSVIDQRATWSAMAYRQDNPRTNSAADFGDGAYGYTGRVTALPIYENEGRCLLHLGVSGTWRNNEKADPGLTGPRVTRFRARPQLRDAIGDFGNGVNPGNTTRWVDTGVFNSTSTGVLGTELFWVLGPFSVQAEYAWAFANAAQLPAAGGVRARDIGTPDFNGGYIQLSYFITGENRIYDRRLGREGSLYQSGPYTPFWLTRAEDGGGTWGGGAWEVAASYHNPNLNKRQQADCGHRDPQGE